MKKLQKLTTSLEDYLEAILFLEEKNRVARVKDIAEFLSVQMPSVTGALKNLRSRGLVEYERNSFINLSKEGLKVAQLIRKKHVILSSFLGNVLRLDKKQADEEACKIEHSISQDTASRIQKLTGFIESEEASNSEAGKRWLNIISE